MPTITDATVVASAYDTSGNGGRKLVRLDNGWLVTVAKTTGYYYFYVDKRDGNGFKQLCYINTNRVADGDISITNKGHFVYVVYDGNTTGHVFAVSFNATTVSNVNLQDGPRFAIENGTQTAIGNISLAINEAKTELHATWASKNSTYQSSFNIRYAKGTINADGTVTWSAVEQVTLFNSVMYYCTEPAITVVNDKPVISTRLFRNYNCIIVLSKTFSTVDQGVISTSEVGSGWGCKNVYNGASYPQSSPSAIFVPQSINGLANGRIWVAWHGTDATDTTSTNIRVSYSDDLGVTWSAMQKLTSGNAYNQLNTSITANKANEIFILFNGAEASYTSYNIKQIKNSGGTWGSVTRITNSTGDNARYPSCLFDLSVNYSSPLFIYQNMQTAKVGFYGTWTATTISVTPGDIGQKTDKNNILSYSITTDGEMSTITEKINGTVVNTRNTTSGQDVTLGLTQAQWDAIRFGKYSNKLTYYLSQKVSDWENGSFNNTVGSPINLISGSNVLRLRQPLTVVSGKQYSVRVSNGYGMYLVETDDSNVIVKNNGRQIGTFSFTPTTNKVYVAINNDGFSTITVSDILKAMPSIEEPNQTIANNTLTVEMGSEKWTYTFDKQLASDSDIISASKAVKDANEVYLPSVKKQLADAINAKGGSVSANADWLMMINNLLTNGTAKANGNVTFTSSSYTININNLGFTPSLVVVYNTNNDTTIYTYFTVIVNTGDLMMGSSKTSSLYVSYRSGTASAGVSTGTAIQPNGFTAYDPYGYLRTSTSNIKWIAIS